MYILIGLFHVHLFTLLLLLLSETYTYYMSYDLYEYNIIIYVSPYSYILEWIYASTYFCSTNGHSAMRMKCEPVFAFRLISLY